MWKLNLLFLLVGILSAGWDYNNMELVGAFPFSGGKAVAVDSVDEMLFLGSGYGIMFFDISDPSSPVPVGRTLTCHARVTSLEYQEGILYVGTEDGMELWDIYGSQSPYMASHWGGERIKDIQVCGEVAYVASEYEFAALDVSSPEWPRVIDTLHLSVNRVIVSGSFAYLATYSRVVIVDVSPPESLVQIAVYDTGEYCNDIAIKGNTLFAYFERDSGDEYGWYSWFYLVALDVSQPSQPRVRDVLDSVGLHLEVVGNYLYAISGDLLIIDISNPDSMICCGKTSWEISYKGGALTGEYLYFATLNGLTTIDVDPPNTPSLADSFLLPRGQGIPYLKGDTIFYMRAVSEVKTELVGFDVSDPKGPELAFWDTLDIPVPCDMVVRKEYAYAVLEMSYEGYFMVFDISDLPAFPAVGSVGPFEFSMECVDICGDRAYVAGRELAAIDISDPGHPYLLGLLDFLDFPGIYFARDVAAVGNLALTVNGDSGLVITDFSDPANPRILSVTPLPNYAMSLAIYGNYAYVYAPSFSFSWTYLIDFSDPCSPCLVKTFTWNTYNSLVYKDNLYFRHHEDEYGSGIGVMSLADPENPELAGYFLLGASGRFTARDNLVFATLGDAGFWIFRYPWLVPPVTDVPPKTSVLIYPSLTRGRAWLSVPLGTGGPVCLAFYDVLGRLVKSMALEVDPENRLPLPLDLEGLGPGVYNVLISTPTERLCQAVIIYR